MLLFGNNLQIFDNNGNKCGSALDITGGSFQDSAVYKEKDLKELANLFYEYGRNPKNSKAKYSAYKFLNFMLNKK